MEANIIHQRRVFVHRGFSLTQTCNCTTKDTKHRSFRVGHLSLDGQLGLDVNIAKPAPNDRNYNRREEEPWGVVHNSEEFHNHSKGDRD